MKKILFDAHTPYQLLVAASIAYTYYPDDYTTLLIGRRRFRDAKKLKKDIQNAEIFSRVEIADDKPSKEIIIDEVESFKLQDTDIYHFSSYSTVSSCYLYNQLLEKSKIILNEEGVATYTLFEKYAEFQRLFPSDKRDPIDLTKLSEIWVFNRALYESQTPQKIKEIDLTRIGSELELIGKLNTLFNYQFSEIKEKHIFFTQNFLDYKVVTSSQVEDFFRNIAVTYRDDIVLKLHPFDKNQELYTKLNLKILQNLDQIPWELVILNHLIRDKFRSKSLITIGSSALSAFSLFLKYREIESDSKYIVMTRLFPTAFNETFEKYFERLSSVTNFKYELANRFT